MGRKIKKRSDYWLTKNRVTREKIKIKKVKKIKPSYLNS